MADVHDRVGHPAPPVAGRFGGRTIRIRQGRLLAGRAFFMRQLSPRRTPQTSHFTAPLIATAVPWIGCTQFTRIAVGSS